MRVSDKTIYTNFLSSYETSATKMQKTLEQLSTEKQVNSASDDPVAASQIINLKSAVAENSMYASTISSATSWNEAQDSALESISDVMLRMRTLVEEAANGTNTTNDDATIKDEVQEDIKQVVSTLNTKFGDSYLFGGENTTTQPFTLETDDDGNITGLTYNGTDQNLSRQISDGVSVDLFANGSKFLTASNSSDTSSTTTTLGSYFGNLVSALNSGDQSALGSDLLGETDDFRDNFVNIRSTIGTLTDRLNSAASVNSSQQTNLKESLSNVQDVDIASAYTQFVQEKTAYQATLAMGSKIMQLNILDYMD
ncbi:flagellar hook-associated protein FlgL [Liquorilactobacillus vini]|uniref:Flagellar hook associated protein n=1 Tax=Liquorilactobacillus vini DSM 20605 TaxID=1133569 RepID=A0A0A7RIP2_9LACO|nr:flagellar hook-associated protein FlgL [Liquorilactobacillus vini]AJA34469.1 flagellar hook-associated protein 3 FlgL [Liquorilactobacillus vini DSM 20605]KRM88614.1 flagellar hook associated protein [Liquorilactobacillus vini DSM 20605]